MLTLTGAYNVSGAGAIESSQQSLREILLAFLFHEYGNRDIEN